VLKTKILVVDDEPMVRRFCKSALTNHGFDPILAENGVHGLDVFTQRRQEIALVLADVSMPKMDGIQMTRRMFELKLHPNILLMTGYSSHYVVPEDMQKMCAVLSKPFSLKGLLEAVEKCLQSERQKERES
jgi:DNA-binding NtrC family response regulator